MTIEKEKINTFFYLKIFILIFILLLLGSVIYKITTEILNSQFVGNSFAVLYVSNDSKLIFVDKGSKRATFLALGDIKRFVKGKNTITASFALGLPLNAMIIDENPPQNLADFSSSRNEMRLIFGTSHSLKNLNRLDVYKLISAVRGSNEDSRKELRVNILTPQGLKLVEEEFKDSSIINEPYTIEIENGTTLNGLGNELALILGREGYNVIAVRTSNEKNSSYISYPGSKNNYIKSLIGLTKFDFKEEEKSQAADVTIYIGDDIEAMLLE